MGPENRAPLPAGRLAARVIVVAATVGGLMAAASAVAGVAVCSGGGGRVPGPADTACYQLVRTMAGRGGIAVAALTAIVLLMMVGLARTARASADPGEGG